VPAFSCRFIRSGEPSNNNYFKEGEYYSSRDKTRDERYYESQMLKSTTRQVRKIDVLDEALLRQRRTMTMTRG
jgi:hypothetical protein